MKVDIISGSDYKPSKLHVRKARFQAPPQLFDKCIMQLKSWGGAWEGGYHYLGSVGNL